MEGAMLDAETKVGETPGDHKDELRLWLRLLTCTTLIEGEVRRRLRERFDVTLPRFDLMAQLDRAEDGMTLGELSRRMMVTNGNVTGLAERLVAEGLLSRRQAENDRRSHMVRLTDKGRRQFRKMAQEHEGWIADLFAGISPREVEALLDLLGKAKASARASIARQERNRTTRTAPGRSSRKRTAASPKDCRPGRRAQSLRSPTIEMPTAACAKSCARSATRAGSRRWCRPRMAG